MEPHQLDNKWIKYNALKPTVQPDEAMQRTWSLGVT